MPPTILSFPNASPPHDDDDYISVNSAITKPSQHSSSSQNNNVAFHAQHYDLDDTIGRTSEHAIPIQEDDNNSVQSEMSKCLAASRAQ